MTDSPWFDDDAGPLVRPFAVTRGRTHPTRYLEMVTLVVATPVVADLPSPEHRVIVARCGKALSVAEVAAGMNLPLGAAKVLISDLIELGALTAVTPKRSDGPAFDRQLIRTVIDGVRRL